MTDDTWAACRVVIEAHFPTRRSGRPPHARQALDGNLYRLLTGLGFGAVPAAFGDDSTVHRHWHRWERAGITGTLLAICAQDPALRAALGTDAV